MRFTAFAMLRPGRIAALCVGVLIATGVAVANAGGAHADDYPGQAEIAAARAAADSQAATVADLDAAVVALEKAQSDAEAAQLRAADEYSQAQGDLETSQAELVTANQRADDAEAALKIAQAQLAAVAQASYRDGGNMGELGAVVTANGFQDAITSSEVMTRASDEMATLVQQVQAAQLFADTMRDAAQKAATRAADAEAAASDAYDNAEAAATAADQAVTDANAVRDDAVNRLAEMRGTSVYLEKERQAGLAAARDAKALAAAKAAQAAAENGGGSTPTKTTDPKPPAPKPTDPPAPKPTDPPAPKRTDPPAPKPTDPPAPKPPATSGGWKSTAAQGETAAAKALTLMGLPYLLGGTGPKAYDCSGLTMTSWKAAGIGIQRSSQMQYNSVKHVAFSDLRKGDLIFYGDNRDPSKIYHVTIYVGNGMVAEATKPGSLSVVRPYDAFWRIDDLIAVAGRP